MEYSQTSLPDNRFFRGAFDAGWARTQALSGPAAAGQYLRGPVAMARLVLGRGGPACQTAAAACLAGPAVFTLLPDMRLDESICALAREIMSVDNVTAAQRRDAFPALSEAARLFLQISAISLLDTLALQTAGDAMQDSYIEALELYSAARGTRDAHSLDTRFEIAAMKVTALLDKGMARAGQKVFV